MGRSQREALASQPGGTRRHFCHWYVRAGAHSSGKEPLGPASREKVRHVYLKL